MTVYRWLADVDRWGTLHSRGAAQKRFDLDDVRPRADGWKPPTLAVDRPSRAKNGDVRELDQGQWAIAPRVADALGHWFTAAGELLPVKCDDGSKMFWFNCTTVVDALDWAASRFDHDDIKAFVFRPPALAGLGLFRLPFMTQRDPDDTDTWVTSWDQFVVARDGGPDFRKLLAANDFRGLELRKVWTGGRA